MKTITMLNNQFHDDLLIRAPSLLKYARKLTGNTELAKDLYQETMFRALIKAHQFREGTNIQAWTFVIMRNIFINECRSRKGKRVAFFAAFTAPEKPIYDYAESNEGESKMIVNYIEESIFKLPRTLKTPLLMHAEGLLCREIADILDQPIGTIKSRIHLARKVLRNIGMHLLKYN